MHNLTLAVFIRVRETVVERAGLLSFFAMVVVSAKAFCFLMSENSVEGIFRYSDSGGECTTAATMV